MNITNFLKSFFGDDRKERKTLKEQIVKGRDEDIKDIQKSLKSLEC